MHWVPGRDRKQMNGNMKLNIAMVAACPFPANHGSAASIREMSEALVRLGHTVHVVTYPIQQDIPVVGVAVHRVRTPLLKKGKVRVGPGIEKLVYDPLMVVKLLQVIWKHKIEVIHAHNYEGALIGWMGKVLTGRPMLYNAVNSMADELHTYNLVCPKALAKWLGELLDKLVPRTGDFVTVVSDVLKEYLMTKGIPQQILKVVPAGVNLQMFDIGDGARIRAAHGLADAPLVMYTGNLEEFQRIEYLLRAMQTVKRQCPDAHLMLVNNIPNETRRAKYLAMAQELGIIHRITFVDAAPLSELPDYLAAADITVVPRPDCPGHPVKLLNYMAAGKATVSFTGAAKGLHHMFNGYLVEDHDYERLGEGILFLLRNENIRIALGANARRTIAGNFDWDTLARGIAVLYHLMLQGPSSREGADKLHHYLRDSYIPRYVERRTVSQHPNWRRFGGDRRNRQVPIDFVERRRVAFGTPREAALHDGADGYRNGEGDTPVSVAHARFLAQ